MLMTKLEVDRLEPEALQLLEAYEKGEHTSLLAEVDQRSKRAPLTASSLGLAAASLVAMDRFDEAATATRGALQQAPEWAWLYRLLGLAEVGRGEMSQAVEAARRAVQLAPQEPEYLATYASCLLKAGKESEAERVARQALALEPTHGESLNQLGLALEAVNRPDEALAQFRLAQQAWPKEPAGYLNEGMLHRRAGRLQEARQSFQAALRQSPGLLEAEDRLAESLSENAVLRKVMAHLLTLARLTLVGWAIIAFLYYLLFRLFEFLWRFFPVLLPIGQVLLVTTSVWLVGGALLGWMLRLSLRRL